MKSPILLTFCSLTALCLTGLSQAKEPNTKLSPRQELDIKQAALTESALKIINKWRGENPQKGKRSLKIVYWSPNDRKPQPLHQERLDTILKDIQQYYAKEMNRLGFGKLSMKFDTNKGGKIEIIEVTGKHPYKHYQVNSGNEILKDAEAELKTRGISAKNETIVIFCNMANWDPDKKIITQNSPYYARGSSQEGVAWQVDSAILKLEDLTNMKDRVQDGQYGNITRGKYNTIFIGGIAHELGHAFGLPHNLERRDERFSYGVALMGSGNRAYGNELRKDGPPAFLTLASGLRLATHPMFSGVTKEMKTPVNYNYKDLQYAIDTQNNLIIKGKMTSSIPCYSIVAFTDPDRGQDYDANTHVCVPSKDGTFTLKIPADSFKRRGKLTKGRIRLVSYFANGATSSNNGFSRRQIFPYSFNEEKKLILGNFIH